MQWPWPGLLIIVLAGSSCARLDLAEKSPTRLPPARLAPDAVVLDVAFVHLPASDQERYDAIWTATDEQVFPPEVRRELAINGMRVGRLGQELPPKLRELIDAKHSQLDEQSDDVNAGDIEVSSGNRHLQ